MVRFKAWGPVLGWLLSALVVWGHWLPAAAVGVVLGFYLLAVRCTRCRVETTQHRPCRWPVRGLLGTCEYHAGLKRRVPLLVSAGAGALMFPLLMWPRPAAASVPAREPQPGAGDAPTLPAEGRSARADRAMAWLVLVSVLITTASLLRDLVAG